MKKSNLEAQGSVGVMKYDYYQVNLDGGTEVSYIETLEEAQAIIKDMKETYGDEPGVGELVGCCYLNNKGEREVRGW